MQWVRSFDFFLFDFDGLLVDTEALHYKAYALMCRKYNFELPWNLQQFCAISHQSSDGIRKEIQRLFPELEKMTPWHALYDMKQAFFLELLLERKVDLMPGVEALLTEIASQGRRMCVVTNSRRVHIESVLSHNPLLQKIGTWLTREDYNLPKPAPDGYLKAIATLGREGDRMIGFEDSRRGILSLQGAGVFPVLICDPSHPQLKAMDLSKVVHFPSFLDIPSDWV